MSLIRTLVAGSSLALSSLAADPGAITGQIQDFTGAVIPGATVELYSDTTGKTSQVKTNNIGRYELGGLQPDDYTMKVGSPGFHLLTVKAINLSDAEHKLMPPLELSISPTGCVDDPFLDYLRFLPLGRLDGYLGGAVRVDFGPMVGNPRPLANAQVSLICAGGRVCRKSKTDSDGQFLFMNLSPDSYGLRFTHPGFYAKEYFGYQVKGGREMVYNSVYLERCALGNCDSKLRPKKPLVICE